MNKKTIHLILFALPFLLLIGCKVDKGEKKDTSVMVEVTRVLPVETSIRKEFPFIAKPFRTSELSFRVSGPVNHFESYAGNFYKQGSSIAEIDPRDFHLRKEQAEAAFRQAKAEYERIESLYNKNNVSASTYEKTRAAYIAAKIAFDKAVNDLTDTRLIAPFDGYVGEVYIEKFQDVRATQPVVSFVDISKLRIEIYVTQDVTMQADSLHNVSLSFDNRPNQVFNAPVIECARSTTPNNLSYLLTAILPNPNGKFSAGMSGKVFFDIPGMKDAFVQIPQTALCHQPTLGDYVWVINTSNNTVSRRNVTLGTLLPGGGYTVTTGLQSDEVIATSSLRFLSEGMKVKIDEHPHVQPITVSGK